MKDFVHSLSAVGLSLSKKRITTLGVPGVPSLHMSSFSQAEVRNTNKKNEENVCHVFGI